MSARLLLPRQLQLLTLHELAVIHCTGGRGLAGRPDWRYVVDLQAYCMKPVAEGGRGMQTGAYHTIVFPSGYVWHYRPWAMRGQHAAGFNFRSVGFAFVGDLDEHAPSMMAMHSMAIEVARYLWEYGLGCTHETVVPHNQLIKPSERQKTCPGIMCCMWHLRRLIARQLEALTSGSIPHGFTASAPIVTPPADDFST